VSDYINVKRRDGTYTSEHTIIVEKALGRKLAYPEQVHHVDGNGRNNTPGNLVVCPDKKYHSLLHLRQKALDASGNPNYRQCVGCKKYDDIAKMNSYGYISVQYYHKGCK
jgi:hypothetical protein